MLEKLSGYIWGYGLAALLLATGIMLTLKSRFFQLRCFYKIFSTTLGAIFQRKRCVSGHTPLQSLSTALGATMGTGNIIGVAAAIALGGAGSVFWMWFSGLFGMVLSYSENYLAFSGNMGDKRGTTAYLERLSRPLALCFAAFCALSSIGMGNMAQTNAVCETMKSAFGAPKFLSAAVCAVLVAFVLRGGAKRLGGVCAVLVPFASLAYMLVAVVVIWINRENIPAAFAEIFGGAMGFRPFFGGTGAAAFCVGLRRGAFSNEAGLGSSPMLHSAANGASAEEIGMWGSFEVFIDTIVCCTLTALVLLCTKSVNIVSAFSCMPCNMSAGFVSACVVLFALATMLGWSLCGEKCIEYLFGKKSVIIYRCVYVLAVLAGGMLRLESVWSLCDIFNGLMAYPNLAGLIVLSGQINYMYTPHGAKRVKNKRGL